MTKTELKELALGFINDKNKIYSKEQVNELLANCGIITSNEFYLIDENGDFTGYEFFSSTYVFSRGIFPINIIPYSMKTPMIVKSRTGDGDMTVDTFDKYRAVFSQDGDVTYIFSLEELIDVLEKHKYVEE